MAGAALLLLLLCAGGVFAVSNFFGGGDEESPPVQGVEIAARAAGEQEAVVLSTDTAEAEPTDSPVPEPGEEPTVAALSVEDTAVPPTPTESPTDTPEPQLPIVRVSVASANLRRGPGTNYATNGAIFRDETATVLAINRDGSWYLVELRDGTRAWLAASVTELANNLALNNVPLAPTIPAAPTLTPVPPTWTPLPLPAFPPTATPGGGGGDDGGDGGGNNGGGDNGGGEYTPEAP
jgi:hypothetical protein